MKVILPRIELVRKLNMLIKMPKNKKTILDIPNNIFFQAKKNGLEMMVYDGYEMFVSSYINGVSEIIKTEEVLFNTEIKLLYSIVSKLEEEGVSLEFLDKYLKINAKGSRFELYRIDLSNAWDSMEKPQVGQFVNIYELNQIKLKELFDLVVVASSGDKENHILSAVKIVADKEKIELIATDGYRASIGSEPVNLVSSDMDSVECVITKEVIPILNGVLKENNNMRLHLSQEAVVFETEDISICVKTRPKEKYPDVKKLLVNESESLIKVNRKEWFFAVDSISNLGSNLVQITSSLNSDTLTIAGESDVVHDCIVSGEIDVPVDKQVNNDVDILFRNGMLMEGIKSMQSEIVEVRIKGSNDFITIRPKEVTNKVYIVLPCRSKKK